ncbi:uncharacterized protein [Symphalangus syndactylus]|uniref:uncharacterized protein n=1 Tax=Symphalangus syndactylus TaxID=9590 RepID=UPI00300797AA
MAAPWPRDLRLRRTPLRQRPPELLRPLIPLSFAPRASRGSPVLARPASKPARVADPPPRPPVSASAGAPAACKQRGEVARRPGHATDSRASPCRSLAVRRPLVHTSVPWVLTQGSWMRS